MAQIEMGLPYYKVDVEGSGYENGFNVTFIVANYGAIPMAGFADEDAVADFIRDALAGHTGTVTTSLRKIEETSTNL